jgi:hypothetical protein
MPQDLFEILIPAGRKFPDEVFFSLVDDRIRRISDNVADRKKMLVIAMEMFQNMMHHGNHEHLSVLRISENGGNHFRITSMNFANADESRRLAGKHRKLCGVQDYRRNFREKLEQKLTNTEPAGNLGLDICFRNSSSSSLRMVPGKGNLDLIHLTFSIGKHGKTAA